MSRFADELIDLVRALAKEAQPAPDGQLSVLWPKVRELGLTGIGIPEDKGGSGGELDDLLVVIRELARAGVDTPIVEASTAAFAIGADADDRFDTVVTHDELDLSRPSLSGDLGVVAFAPFARRAVVVGAAGVAMLELADADIEAVVDIAGRPCGRVRVGGSPGTHPDVDAEAVAERLALARSAALIGGCWGAYDMTKRYVVERHQFGAPLARISAVASNLAHMAVGIRTAEAAMRRAVEAAEGGGDTALRRLSAAATARIAAAQCATAVARTAHQLHGAIGITTEYGLHRFTRSLWAQRDADRSQLSWSGRLGAAALAVDEETFWDQLSA